MSSGQGRSVQKWFDARINPDRLRNDLEELSAIGRLETGGVHRAAFSEAYQEASAWLLGRMCEAGLHARVDPVGNVLGRLGTAAPTVISGSHIDTVPGGGSLDGAFGVLAALECARTIRDIAETLPRALEIAAFVDEEGSYLGCLGSLAFTDQLAANSLDQARNSGGRPLIEAMEDVGLYPRGYSQAARDSGEIAAFIELHIEQGPVLEQSGVSIGIVEGIVGINQMIFRFLGQPDHAGTTPMDLRKDAFSGAARFATEARELVMREGSPSTRLTYGVINAKPQSVSVIPFEVELRQELREVSLEKLDYFVAQTKDLAKETAQQFKLELYCEEVIQVAPADMSQTIQRRIEAACKLLGLDSLRLASGAGHDAQVFAKVTNTGMIFVPSKGGRSHRPDEWTDWIDLESGANVLLHTLLSTIFESHA